MTLFPCLDEWPGSVSQLASCFFPTYHCASFSCDSPNVAKFPGKTSDLGVNSR